MLMLLWLSFCQFHSMTPTDPNEMQPDEIEDDQLESKFGISEWFGDFSKKAAINIITCFFGLCSPTNQPIIVVNPANAKSGPHQTNPTTHSLHKKMRRTYLTCFNYVRQDQLKIYEVSPPKKTTWGRLDGKRELINLSYFAVAPVSRRRLIYFDNEQIGKLNVPFWIVSSKEPQMARLINGFDVKSGKIIIDFANGFYKEPSAVIKLSGLFCLPTKESWPICVKSGFSHKECTPHQQDNWGMPLVTDMSSAQCTQTREGLCLDNFSTEEFDCLIELNCNVSD